MNWRRDASFLAANDLEVPMLKLALNDPETKSTDVVEENVDALKALFPEAFEEGKIDFEVLKQLLGGAIDERDEKYGLNWHDKRRARQIALTPSTGTLLPCPEESVDWDTTQNLMIEGENLEVLKIIQKSYGGKVKLIYIDPPYNTGNDFVYPDDFSDSIANYLKYTGQTDNEGQKVSSRSEASGRFHTDWLNMMYPRLKLAKTLLRNDGVIAISIDDGEISNLIKLCDEIFGEENRLGNIVWQKRYVSNVTAKWLSDMHDFVVVYAKNRENVKINSWTRTPEQLEAYKNPDNDPRGVWRAQDLSASKPYAAGLFTIIGPTGNSFDPPPNRYWRCNREQFQKWVDDGRIWWGVNRDARPMLKAFLEESERGITPNTWWDYDFAGHNKEATLELKALFDGDAPFDTPKPVKLMRRLIDLFTSGGDTVLDFFCGSGAFGQAALEASVESELPFRFTLVQFPEPLSRKDYPTIFRVASERLRRAGKSIRSRTPKTKADLGFRVFKLASSNIRAWEPNPADMEESLLTNAEHLAQGRSEHDVLYELLLKLGLDLCVPIEMKVISGKTVHSVGGGALIVCLADGLNKDVVESLGSGIVAWYEVLAPAVDTRVVFKDSGFADDIAKTNMAAILNQNGITDVRSL
ncbi:site-specific DNA-methyltransferase [Mesorhizobium sp. M1328]|uniref:site-specific DNA-methyltransferase n=1 Tax=Mesorhizobium sp. M1328 TaxID=2957082 RepID=UPI00333DA5DE